MNKEENPIAIRSKEMLSSALIELMQEKSYLEISITEITNRADLSRRTFYRLFDSKDDILVYYLYSNWCKVLPELHKLEDKSYMNTSYLNMKFLYAHKDFMLLLYKNNLMIILQKFIDKISGDIYKHQGEKTIYSEDSEALEYALAYSTGGALYIIWNWVRHGMDKTPEEIMEMFNR